MMSSMSIVVCEPGDGRLPSSSPSAMADVRSRRVPNPADGIRASDATAAAVSARGSGATLAVARYLYKMGVVVTDDVVERASDEGRLPIEGSLIVRLIRPVRCVFISYGLGGISIPDNGGLCVIGDGWNPISKEERLATANMMRALDFENRLSLRASWMLIDLVEARGRVLRSPTDGELVELSRRFANMRSSDRSMYKTIARIARRRTTAGADIPDGHECDSDRDPLMTYIEDMSRREEKAESARKKRLGNFPDTPFGQKMSRLYPRSSSSSSAVSSLESTTQRRRSGGVGADRSRGLTTDRCRNRWGKPCGRRSGGSMMSGLPRDPGSISDDRSGGEVDDARGDTASRDGHGPPSAVSSLELSASPSPRSVPRQTAPQMRPPPAPSHRMPADLSCPSYENLFGSEDEGDDGDDGGMEDA